MKILVDISHPAHVHFFKYAIYEWQAKKHTIKIVARDKDLTLDLLDEYGFNYSCLSKMRKGIRGLAIELLEHQSKLFQVVREFKPDILLNIGGTFIVHVSRLLGIKTLVFTDTENARLSNLITFPFASLICTPSCYKEDIGRKQVRYRGYHELAYLHPNRFVPNPAILNDVGLGSAEKFFIIRFVSWGAAHDVGQSGFSIEGKRKMVRCLAELGRVIITSESPLPLEFEPYRMRVSPKKIHDLLAFSTLYIGESATMASESAILGTPFIFVSPVGRGYTDEQEKKYNLGYTIHPSQEDRAIELALELVHRSGLRQEWQMKRKRMLQDKIDVTAWMVDFIENFKPGDHIQERQI
jgi:uncharacterized protein